MKVCFRFWKNKDPIFSFERSGRYFGTFFATGDQVWFSSGRSYNDHLFFNLTTRVAYERRSESPFIWTHVSASANGRVLAVEGCEWSAPPEIRFFDFSDPQNGWPEIQVCWDRVVAQFHGFYQEDKSYWNWTNDWQWQPGDPDCGDTFVYTETCKWDRVLKKRITWREKEESQKQDRDEIIWYQAKVNQEIVQGRLKLFVTDIYFAPQWVN